VKTEEVTSTRKQKRLKRSSRRQPSPARPDPSAGKPAVRATCLPPPSSHQSRVISERPWARAALMGSTLWDRLLL